MVFVTFAALTSWTATLWIAKARVGVQEVRMRATNFRSWQNIIYAYVGFVEQKVSENWKPYLLSFQFVPLKGKATSIIRPMQNEIETVYRKLVSRVQRHPTTKNGSKNVPILLASPDLPVFKWNKLSIQDVTINEGLHYHGIMLLPPLACTRFRRHRVRCFNGTGGGSWRDGSLRGSSSLRL